VFVRFARGAYVSVSRSLGRNAALTLAYRPELTELQRASELTFCVNFLACAENIEELSDALSEPHWLSPLTLSYTMDRTDALFTPSRGYILRADLEYASRSTGSDFAYTRLLGEGSAYMGEPEGLILAARVRGGIGWPHEGVSGIGLNPQKRFFAGGPNSVRGFDQYRLGPTLLGIDAVPWLVDGDDPATERADGAGCTAAAVNAGSCDAGMLASGLFDLRPSGGEVLLEGNLELRFPIPVLSGRVRGAAFVDAGQVWTSRDDVALAGVVTTPGVGLRYYSPIGPIRLDAAFNPRGPESLRVITTQVASCKAGQPSCERVQYREPRDFLTNTDDVTLLNPRVVYGSSLDEIDSVSDFFRRFKLHFSIGQAF
ncbi:MAG: BamA/TamA family outer membrane protein, partial [Gemmatimonadetes bacterium]|nr:BamA/TamA family outer membrane protein [Gemmatimonadota bacterium]NIQ56575.1 BamA/TamA family outer membrane protein [Gemmatimonadota bacterium]NIU76774.1 BamA/TamA family outer membrane protein [Gammaproteobacteria bacterium]NIX46167.1 BamA/TamA family outer membrane protein [Gemmatimonadota bacterium]